MTPSNSDVEIHDSAQGRNRFLRFELKGPKERTIARGQLEYLRGLASLKAFTVRVLRGTTKAVEVRRVTAEGIEPDGFLTHAEAIRRGVDRWLNGVGWPDIEADLSRDVGPIADLGHTHGWVRVEGVWTCVQDHYAVGFRPDTGCGEQLPQFS